MKSFEKVYLFLYSEKDQRFETCIMSGEANIQSLQLRARLNTQRDISLYGFISIPSIVKTLNEKLNSSICDKEIFEELRPKIKNIGF